MADERADPASEEWTNLAAPHLARYLFAAEYARDAAVLDAGSGAGYGAALLKALGAERVTGVDRDPAAVAAAADRYGAPGLEFLLDDCEALAACGGGYDLICCFEVIEHVEHPERLLAAAAERLSESGTMLVSTPDRAASPPYRDGRPANPYHVREWYRDEFCRLLHEHFGSVAMRVQVETAALAGRIRAVKALRSGFIWANPLSALLWRRYPFSGRRADRPWKQLEGLAAASPADYPVVHQEIAPLIGTSRFHVAICGRPLCGARPPDAPAEAGSAP